MNKALALIPVIFAIFSLVVSPAVMDVSAEKGGNGKSNGDPSVCDKEDHKGQAQTNNPNCGGRDSDNDGITDAVEIASSLTADLTINCLDWEDEDSDGDGWIDGFDDYPCDGEKN